MGPDEQDTCRVLVERLRQYLLGHYHPSGINVGFNCGRSAGQTVFHAHIHVIPRCDGDTPNPRGGVRNCIHKSLLSTEHEWKVPAITHP